MRVSYHTRFALRVLSKVRLLKYLNLYPKVQLGGRSIKLPIIGGVGYQNLFPTEPWLGRTIGILQNMKEGAFIDVGINLGQTLLKFIEYFDGRAYYGFEPNALCFAYAEEIKKINKLQSVTIIPVGLSDKDSVTKMFLIDNYDSSASIIEGYREEKYYSMSKHVPVFRGDELLENLGVRSVCILKIDVEGAELEVLTGLRHTITKLKPFIFCEILPVYDENSAIGNMRRNRIDRVVEFVCTAGYKIVRLLPDGRAVPLESIDTHSNLQLCEYLFVPEESVEAVHARLHLASK
jgi:FkbM family methyltransferase